MIDPLKQFEVDIHMTRLKTGEPRLIKSVVYDRPHLHAPQDFYLWEEGNFACNCNRSIFWLKGGSGAGLTDEEIMCSGTRAFQVQIFYQGVCLYSEVQ